MQYELSARGVSLYIVLYTPCDQSVSVRFACPFRYGMSVNSDSVTRSIFYKYLHPKEVYISEGILVPDLIRKKVHSIWLQPDSYHVNT